MATLIAHITVLEGGEGRFEEIARELFRDTADREPGVRVYEYWRAQEPRHYYALVGCDDFVTFLAHQTSDHHEAASPRLGEVVESIRLEWVDPVEGASRLPPTRSQELLPDADELMVRYSQVFAVSVAAWWEQLRRWGRADRT